MRVLEVRRRSTVQPGGSVAGAETVYCPSRQGTVELGTCAACADCLEIGVQPWGGRVVTCHGYGSDRAGAQPRDADEVRVASLMTASVHCVAPEVSAIEVARLLTEKEVSGLPVVDETGHPLGVVSRSDLVRLQALGEGPDGEPAVGNETAADLMTPVTFALREHASVAQAAALMAFEGIHRVPIVSASNRVVGILSATDIMRWLGEQNGYVARRP